MVLRFRESIALRNSLLEKISAQVSSRTVRRVVPVLLVVWAAGVMFLSFPFLHGASNQFIYYTMFFKYYWPESFARDWFVMEETCHVFFGYLIVWLGRALSFWQVSLAGSLCCWLLICSGLYLMVEQGFPERRYLTFFLTTAFVAGFGIPGLGGMHIGSSMYYVSIFEPYFIAAAAAVLGMGLLVRESYLWSGVALGIGVLMHPAIFYVTPLLAGIPLVCAPQGKRTRLAATAIVPFTILALPQLYYIIWDLQFFAPTPLDHVSASISVNFRRPHHVFPTNWDVFETWRYIGSMLIAVGSAMLLVPRSGIGSISPRGGNEHTLDPPAAPCCQGGLSPCERAELDPNKKLANPHGWHLDVGGTSLGRSLVSLRARLAGNLPGPSPRLAHTRDSEGTLRILVLLGGIATVVFVPVILMVTLSSAGLGALELWKTSPLLSLISMIFVGAAFARMLSSELSPTAIGRQGLGFVLIGMGIACWYRGGRFHRIEPLVIWMTAVAVWSVARSRLSWGRAMKTALSMALVLSTIVISVAYMYDGLKRSNVWTTRPPTHRQEVFDWIRTHTTQDSLFLVPVSMEDFRMKALRSIVVDFKCVPFTKNRIVHWYDLITDVCDTPKATNLHEAEQGFNRLGKGKIEELRDRYNLDYVLLDRRNHVGDIDDIPVAYQNDSYTVLDLRSAR